MKATIVPFKRRPHALVERGGEPSRPTGDAHFTVWLIDSRGRPKAVWSGWGAANALAEAIYLDCPILLRLGATVGGPA